MEEQEIHLRDYLKVIQKRKATVILFFLITLTVVVIGTFRMVPVYQASIQVMVEKNEAIPLMGNVYYNAYDPEFFATQEQLIKSQNVARKVVQLLRLEETYDSFFPEDKEKKPSFVKATITGLKTWVKGLFPADESSKDPAVVGEERSRTDILADTLRKGVSVSPVNESRMININFQSRNPVYASLVANTIAKAYQGEVMAIQMHSSGYALQWMTQKANEEKEKLAAAEKRLQHYMQQHDIVTVEDRVAIVPQRLTGLTQKLSDTQASRQDLESLYKQIEHLQKENGDLEALHVIADNQGLQEMREKVREAQRHILELKQKYGRKHPVMIEARANLAELEKKKQLEIEKIIASVKNQYETALAQEENARSSLADVKEDALLLNEKMTEYNILKRDVDSIRALYDALIMRIKEKGVSEKNLKVNVWTTQKAEPPQSPIKPNKKRNILLGIILGLFGGIGFVFFLEYLDNTVRDPEEAEQRFQVPVLGICEKLKKEQDPDTLLVDQPTSSWAESYKSMRTSLLLSSADTPPKVLLVTSTTPAEGKTTTALNLAISLAQTERSVLLIDTDLRKPRLHSALGINNATGLSTLLTNKAEKVSLVKMEQTGVSVLTAGPSPPNPAELLGSESFARLLGQMRQKYDMIVIDSSPIFSATDSLITASLVDGVILVVSAGKTTNDAVARGLKNLADIRAKVLGLAMNNVELKGNEEYYSYYGYYSKAYKES